MKRAKIYKCGASYCGMTFNDNKQRVNHERIHFPRKRCPFCDSEYSRDDDLKHHIVSVHDQIKTLSRICEECGSIFQSSKSLNKHHRLKHRPGMEGKRKKLKSKLSQMNCETCSKVFLSKSSFNRHQKAFHQNIQK